MTNLNHELITTVASMLLSHQLDGINRVYAMTAVFEDVAMSAKCEGHAAIRQFFQDSVTAFPNFSFTLHEWVADATLGASEWTMAGVNTGWALGIAATGRTISIRGSSFFRFRQRQIIQQSDYWSLQEFNDQLGL